MASLILGYKSIYYIRYKKPDGKFTTRSTGTKNERKAEKFMQKFFQEQDKPVFSKITLQQLIIKFIEIQCNGNKDKAEEMKHRCCNLLLDYFGKEKIVDSLTVLDFENYKRYRLSKTKHFDKTKTISPTTVNIELRAYKAILNKAIKWELITKNPLNKFPLCKVTKKKKQILTIYEKELLLNTIQHKELKNIVIFTLLTGCRISEVLNLKWKDIDFQSKVINIISKEDWNTKTGEIRQFPMSPELFNFIKDLYIIKNNNSINFLDKYVFSKDNGFKFNLNYISRKFKWYIRKCKIDEDIHFHSLRHTAVTDLIRAGESLNKVKDFIGHKNIATTMGYTHLVVDDLRDTATKLTVNFS